MKTIFNSLESTDQFLYHYTTREILFENIIPSGMLKMGLFGSTNDPKESKEWYFGIECIGDNPIQAIKIEEEFQNKINSLAKKHYKVSCFTKDKEKEASNSFSIFHRGFAHSRMWAQYADNHKGVCLILDKNNLHETIHKELGQIGKIWHGTVKYENKPAINIEEFKTTYEEINSNGIESTARKHLEMFYNKLFFHKVKDWSDENEYRYLLFSNDSKQHYFSITNSIKGICLGVDFNEIYIYSILPFCKENNVDVAKIQWHNSEPHVSRWP